MIGRVYAKRVVTSGSGGIAVVFFRDRRLNMCPPNHQLWCVRYRTRALARLAADEFVKMRKPRHLWHAGRWWSPAQVLAEH
jgi:hypothetical protein